MKTRNRPRRFQSQVRPIYHNRPVAPHTRPHVAPPILELEGAHVLAAVRVVPILRGMVPLLPQGSPGQREHLRLAVGLHGNPRAGRRDRDGDTRTRPQRLGAEEDGTPHGRDAPERKVEDEHTAAGGGLVNKIGKRGHFLRKGYRNSTVMRRN